MTLSQWIKQFLPRGLYGRAALILIVPVVTIQLVVSSVFLQRHFEGVTSQLSNALTLDLALILDTWASDVRRAAEDLATALDVEIAAPEFDGGTSRAFSALSGIWVAEGLTRNMEAVGGIDMLAEQRRITILPPTPEGQMAFSTARRRVSAAAPHQLLVIMVATGILMTLVAYAFLRNQLKPIRRLAEASENFGKGRTIAYRPSGATEVRSAGRAFLDMRDRIEGHLEQRTLMLSGVSHDLRTPLTRMRLSLGMMEDSAERADLNRDVDEMEALLNTFLDFVRGEALDDPVTADATALAEQVAEDGRRAGGKVSYVRPNAEIMAPMRPLAVQRALSNLMSNARRYAAKVRLQVTADEAHVQFSIEDDGPGIPADRRDEALKPFIRLDAARNQNQGSGVGLGLAIADDIARRHGGALILSDSADLGGLRVDLRLPR